MTYFGEKNLWAQWGTLKFFKTCIVEYNDIDISIKENSIYIINISTYD